MPSREFGLPPDDSSTEIKSSTETQSEAENKKKDKNDQKFGERNKKRHAAATRDDGPRSQPGGVTLPRALPHAAPSPPSNAPRTCRPAKEPRGSTDGQRAALTPRGPTSELRAARLGSARLPPADARAAANRRPPSGYTLCWPPTGSARGTASRRPPATPPRRPPIPGKSGRGSGPARPVSVWSAGVVAAARRDGWRRSSGVPRRILLTIKVPARGEQSTVRFCVCGAKRGLGAAGPQPCGEGRGCGSGAACGERKQKQSQAGQEEPCAEGRAACGPRLAGSPGIGAAAAVGLSSQV